MSNLRHPGIQIIEEGDELAVNGYSILPTTGTSAASAASPTLDGLFVPDSPKLHAGFKRKPFDLNVDEAGAADDLTRELTSLLTENRSLRAELSDKDQQLTQLTDLKESNYELRLQREGNERAAKRQKLVIDTLTKQNGELRQQKQNSAQALQQMQIDSASAIRRLEDRNAAEREHLKQVVDFTFSLFTRSYSRLNESERTVAQLQAQLAESKNHLTGAYQTIRALNSLSVVEEPSPYISNGLFFSAQQQRGDIAAVAAAARALPSPTPLIMQLARRSTE